jgi:1-acyl-sn-glycerol-3-phosphate acyltransferase
MSRRLRTGYRLAAVVAVIGGFLIESALRELGMAALALDEPRRRNARSRALGRWGRFLLGRLGFGVALEPRGALPQDGGALIVANHLSFWDTVAIASRVPVVFVTSVEVRDTPLLGWITRAGGCIFVERRERRHKDAERAEVARALREGARVVLFPEATSTDGSGVLPFKRSFFSPAIEAGCPVVPMCIHYAVDGRPVSSRNRDDLFYYGEQKFETQLLRTLRLDRVTISVDVLEPIGTRAGLTDREELVERAYEAVSSRFVPVEG